MKKIDPDKYELPARTELIEINQKHIAIVKRRKSRIIMKDGEAILHYAEKIRVNKNIRVSLMTDAPVCSKTILFLKQNKIEVIPL